MKPRTRRRVRRPPDLTSLFDVLFIVVFVALIRAAAAEHAVAAAKEPPKPLTPPPKPVPVEIATLKQQALTNISTELAGRAPLIVRISETGVITQIEVDGKKLALDLPLLVHDPDPTIRIAYQGDRSAQLRACRIAALQLDLDLANYVVIFAPVRAKAELPHALIAGLERDVARCLADQRAIATIVEPVVPPRGKP